MNLEKEAQEYFENNIFCDGITEFEKDVCIKSFIAGYKWAKEQKQKENTRSMDKLIESNQKFDEQQKPKKNDRDSYEGDFDSGMWLSTIQ